jgi:Ca2+-binding EF-hand superfamily protein
MIRYSPSRPQTDTAMLRASPEDPMLIKMVETANRRLREAQIQEENHAKDIPHDDILYVKQFLALSKHDMNKMKYTFKTSLDSDGDGKITVQDYVAFLSEPLSMAGFIRQIFALSSNQNLDSDNYLNANLMMDIGSTLKATAVFCMLSSSDLLKFVFACYDEDGYGTIDNNEFKQMLASFHPRHSDEHVARALKEFDLTEGGSMSFETFESLIKKLPHLLYPAFRVQEKMQKIFMGRRFWKRKLSLYEEAKRLVIEDEEQAKLAERRERKQREEYAADLRLSAIDRFVEKSKKKRRRRHKL